MRRGVKIAAVAIAAFAAVLIARFPARWAIWVLTDPGTTCLTISGTLWSGACTGLAQSGSPIGDLTWELHPLRLLLGSLSADVALSRGSGTVSARADVGPSGTVTARGLRAVFPLDRTVLPQLGPGTQGSAQADIPLLRFRGSRILAVRGRIDVHGLTLRGELIGDYRLSFPAGVSSAPSAPSGAPGTGAAGSTSGEIVGRLTDLGGPFSVEGTVRLTPEPGYVVEALVAARPGAPPDAANALRYLGAPDASGRRPFTFSGTF
jgi:Type II secretion system (T2SS), protein N